VAETYGVGFTVFTSQHEMTIVTRSSPATPPGAAAVPTQATAASPASRVSWWDSVRGPPLVIFGVCLAGWTLSNLDQSLFGYAIPGINREFGSDLSDIGWILSASFALAAVMTVVLGMLADAYGRKRLFVVTLAVSALLVGLQGFAPTLLILAAIRIPAFGVSNGLAPIVLSYNVEASPARFRGIFAGLLSCGYPLGWFMGSIIAAPLMATHGWRAIFLPALAVVPLAIVLTRWLPESPRFHAASIAQQSSAQIPRSSPWRSSLLFSQPLRRRTIACMIANFFFGGAYAGTAFFFPTFYHEVRGYTVSQSTYIVGIAYGIGTLGYLLSAFVGEFVLSRRNTSALWFFVGAVALLCMVWLPRNFAQDILAFGLLTSFFYGSQGAFGVFTTEIFPTHIRATGLAIAASCPTYLGFALFPVLMPWAVSHLGWQGAFSAVSAPALVSAAVAVLFMPNFRSGIDIDEMQPSVRREMT
jgi:putative MFS transporter